MLYFGVDWQVIGIYQENLMFAEEEEERQYFIGKDAISPVSSQEIAPVKKIHRNFPLMRHVESQPAIFNVQLSTQSTFLPFNEHFFADGRQSAPLVAKKTDSQVMYTLIESTKYAGHGQSTTNAIGHVNHIGHMVPINGASFGEFHHAELSSLSYMPKYVSQPFPTTIFDTHYQENFFAMDDSSSIPFQQINHENRNAVSSLSFSSHHSNSFPSYFYGSVSSMQRSHPASIQEHVEMLYPQMMLRNKKQRFHPPTKQSILSHLDATAALANMGLFSRQCFEKQTKAIQSPHHDMPTNPIEIKYSQAQEQHQRRRPVPLTENPLGTKRPPKPALKMACTTCIRGHRAPSCKHYDRALFTVRPRGRPSSLCHRCLEKISNCSCCTENSEKAFRDTAQGMMDTTASYAKHANLYDQISPTSRLGQYYQKIMTQTQKAAFPKND